MFNFISWKFCSIVFTRCLLFLDFVFQVHFSSKRCSVSRVQRSHDAYVFKTWTKVQRYGWSCEYCKHYEYCKLCEYFRLKCNVMQETVQFYASSTCKPLLRPNGLNRLNYNFKQLNLDSYIYKRNWSAWSNWQPVKEILNYWFLEEKPKN